jgi:hypothetical protein
MEHKPKNRDLLPAGLYKYAHIGVPRRRAKVHCREMNGGLVE